MAESVILSFSISSLVGFPSFSFLSRPHRVGVRFQCIEDKNKR